MLVAAMATLALPAAAARAGILGTYTFAGNDPAGDNDTPVLNGTAATGLAYTGFARSGLSFRNAANNHSSSGFGLANAINTAQYVEFSVSTSAGYALELTGLSYSTTRSNNGPRSGAVRSSFEGYAAGSGTGSTWSTATGPASVTNNWAFSPYISGSAGTATFRFYGWDAQASNPGANLAIDDVTLNGDVIALARMTAVTSTPPAATVIVGSASSVNVNVNNVAAGGTKQQSLAYTLSGTGELSGGGGNAAMAPGGTDDQFVLTIDTGAAGARGGDVQIASNAYSTNGTVGSAYSQAVSVNVLDHANASLSASSDVDSITIDFGTVAQGSAQAIAIALSNLELTTGFTAGLDLDSLAESDPNGVFSTDLAGFLNMAAGGSAGFLVNLDTTQTGLYSGSFTIGLSDQDLPGAAGPNSQVLTVFTVASVVAVPEPSAGLLLIASALLLRRRRAGA